MLKSVCRRSVAIIALMMIGLGLSNCKGCQDDVQEVVDLCESEADKTYLLSIRNVDFDAIGTKLVADPNRILNICQDHFAANTDAGHEVIVATNELTDIEGVEIYYGRTWLPHENKAGLFSNSPTNDWFDYVDNQLDTSADHPCHDDGSILCSDTDTEDGWAINTCKFNGTSWNGSGDTEYFTVSTNVYCYDHYSDPSSVDYPKSNGVLHELAHGMGMNHSNVWAEADKKFMSTMQGKHIHLTALDVAYLRERYPDSMPDHRNYVAGSKTRFDDGAGGWDGRVFFEDNPLEFYVDTNGNLKDCATKKTLNFMFPGLIQATLMVRTTFAA
ncbi:MAG: hypothetical protein IPK82_06715 [Polyangiaceae bacterium]|nr:hypothetical protein [Polyangiaceae bacterium]